MPLSCEHCGTMTFRLRRAQGGAQAECTQCGKVIPNSILRAAVKVSAEEESKHEPPLSFSAGT
jgi:uncharacterized Zn finger protein